MTNESNVIVEIVNELHEKAEKVAKTLFEKGLTNEDVELDFEIDKNEARVVVRAKSKKGYRVLKELNLLKIDEVVE